MIARRQRGFTLSELMIVVAIIGVLVTLGIALFRANPGPVDVASQVSNKLAETSRKAVSLGTVRPDVAAAVGSKARTQAVFTATASGVEVVIERLEEDPAPATTARWIELSRVRLHPSVILEGITSAAMLSSGNTPAVAIGASGTFTIACSPDGTCAGVTVYLRDRRGGKKARVVLMPLGGTPMTFDTW